MKKQYAIRALNKLKEIHETYFKLKELGVDLINYEGGVNLLEESIAIIFSGNDEKKKDLIIDDVQWWLYENVDKVIYLPDEKKIGVIHAEEFVDYLDDWYK